MLVGLLLAGLFLLVQFIRGYLNPDKAIAEGEEVRKKTESLG